MPELIAGPSRRPPRTVAHRSLSAHGAIVAGLTAALVLGVGGWAATTELSSAVMAGGRVAVGSNVKTIQHPTGGVIDQVLVAEGDRVEAGQVLVRLDGTLTLSSLGIVRATLAQHYVRRARLLAERIGAETFEAPAELDALLDGEKRRRLLDNERSFLESRVAARSGMRAQLASRKLQLAEEERGLDAQIDSTAAAIGQIDQELVGVDDLYRRQLIGVQRVTGLRRDRAELEAQRGNLVAARAQALARQTEIDLQIVQIDDDLRSEVSRELTEVESGISEFEQRRAAAEDQLRRLEIRAPQGGRVYQVAVHTVQGVVGPADVLMLLVPDDELIVEAQLRPQDIDQVVVGQAVAIRMSAFDQRTTPEMDGAIATISPNLVTDQASGASYYPLRIRLDPASFDRLGSLQLQPGMPAEAFIATGSRTALSYLLKPLLDQMNRAFRES